MNAYLKRIWSNSNYRIAVVILLIALIWLVSGQGGSTEQTEEQSGVRGITAVKARYISAEDYAPTIKVRARTEAARRVELRAETAARLVALPVSEGQLVSQGDVLCELAIDDRQLRVIEARSAAEQAQLEFDASQKLRLGGHQSQTALAAAKSRLDAAKANLGSRWLDLANTKSAHPLPGWSSASTSRVGSYMDRGGLCAVLLDLDPILFTGQVSEGEVGQLREGQPGQAQLLDGNKIEARLRFIGREAGNATRTFRVEAVADNKDYAVRSGLTVELDPADSLAQRAHRFPLHCWRWMMPARLACAHWMQTSASNSAMSSCSVIRQTGCGCWVCRKKPC